MTLSISYMRCLWVGINSVWVTTFRHKTHSREKVYKLFTSTSCLVWNKLVWRLSAIKSYTWRSAKFVKGYLVTAVFLVRSHVIQSCKVELKSTRLPYCYSCWRHYIVQNRGWPSWPQPFVDPLCCLQSDAVEYRWDYANRITAWKHKIKLWSYIISIVYCILTLEMHQL